MGIDHLHEPFGEAWSSEPSAGDHYERQGFELYGQIVPLLVGEVPVTAGGMSRLEHRPISELRQASGSMSGLVFDNPAGGQPATAAEYLSGNIRQPLDQAGRAVEKDPPWQGSSGRASRSFGRPARS